MELLLTGKQYTIEQEQKDLCEKLANKLAADYTKLNSLQVVISKERGWYLAEARLTGKNISLNATSKATDINAAINKFYEKLDKQMRRYLERIQELSIKPDAKAKERIWTSTELKDAGDDDDLL
jgi:ribosomal subunit interface protein